MVAQVADASLVAVFLLAIGTEGTLFNFVGYLPVGFPEGGTLFDLFVYFFYAVKVRIVFIFYSAGIDLNLIRQAVPLLPSTAVTPFPLLFSRIYRLVQRETEIILTGLRRLLFYLRQFADVIGK